MAEVITFGCRLNSYESELIKKNLGEEQKDLVVINSCAVTNEAERKVKQTIRKVHRSNPEKKIVVVGCAAQLNPHEYLELSGVYKVLGNVEKLDANNYSSNEKILTDGILAARPQLTQNVARFINKSRAFIQIQNGCDHDCTFCAITKARGNNRSISVENIIDEIAQIVQSGHNEIVLTGVDITDYGKDLLGKPSFSFLIKRILSDVKSLKRLRLSSIDVAEVDELLIDLIKNEGRLMPHIHLSLQSGDSIILKRMKRRHTPQQVYKFHEKVINSRKNIGFGADVITGFPTESEEMFANTYKLIKDLEIPYLHVFPYSAKSGTKAALMPQVDVRIRKERAKALIKLGNENLEKFHESQIGEVHSVVMEKDKVSRAENFCLVKLDNVCNSHEKDIIRAKIYSIEGDLLLGKAEQY